MKRCLSLFILFLTPFLLSAQNQVKIANDPAIVSGKLSNGLTYYLVKDSQEYKGFADFYMVQKYGSSVENESETGMMEFLAGMNLYETRGFPEGSLFQVISDQGAVPDHSVVKYVGRNDIILGLKDIPVSSSGTVIDEALTALLNMCSGADLTDDICRGWGFEASQVKEFQKKWFRPDLQAIVITGDIDIQTVKDKISLLFLSIPRSPQSLPQVTTDNSGLREGMTDYDVAIDCRADQASVSVQLIHKSIPRNQRDTPVALVQDYINSIMCYVLDSRIRNRAKHLPFPVIIPAASMGRFDDAAEGDGIRITLRTTPEHICKAAGFLSCIINDFSKGISGTEFDTAASLYQGSGGELTEREYPVKAGHYVTGCFKHFLEGYTLPSTDEKGRYISKLRTTFTLKSMNDYIASFISSDTYRLVRAVSPYPVSLEDLSTACIDGPTDFAFTLHEAASTNLPSLAQVGGKLKAPTAEPVTGSMCFSLPNFTKIYFKQNSSEPGKVSFLAVSRGGLSMADKSSASICRYINDLAPLSMPQSPCPSQVTLTREFTPDRIYLRGTSTTAELETLFKMVRASFLSCRIEENDFRRKMEELTMTDAVGYGSPCWRMEHFLSGFLKSRKDYSALDCATASDFIAKCFFNIGSFSILISGDCTQDRIKELAEQYLLSIPGKRSQLLPVPGVFSFETGGADIKQSMEMDCPESPFGMSISGDCQYSFSGMLKARVISNLIRQAVSETLFKDGTIVSTSDRFYRYPTDKMSVEFRLQTEETLSYYRKVISEVLAQLSEEGVPDERIEMTKKYIFNSILRSESSRNDYWTDVMEARFNGKNFCAEREAAMAGLTPTDVNQSLKDFLKNASRISVTITPEEIIIPELPPIEYEDPFPTPLDMTFVIPDSEPVQEEEVHDESNPDDGSQNDVTEDNGGQEDVGQAEISGISDK